MPVGHLGMTASLAQKTRFELGGRLAAIAVLPARQLDHGLPRNPPRERAAQPGCSSQALRRSRRAGGGRHSPTESGAGEVRVRMLASGLEYTAVVIRRHLYPQTMRRRPPFVLGYDVVGEIDHS